MPPANFIWCHLCLILEETVNRQSLCALFGAYSSIDVALAVVQLLMKGLEVSQKALCTAVWMDSSLTEMAEGPAAWA